MIKLFQLKSFRLAINVWILQKQAVAFDNEDAILFFFLFFYDRCIKIKHHLKLQENVVAQTYFQLKQTKLVRDMFTDIFSKQKQPSDKLISQQMRIVGAPE